MRLSYDVVTSGPSGPHRSRMKFFCFYCGKQFPRGKQVLGHVVGKHIANPRLRNTTISVDHLTDLQKGYLAGFLDGEGGIQITRSSRKGRRYRTSLHPVVYFTNTNHDAIQAIRDWLRAGCIITARQRQGLRDLYVLHITGIRNIKRVLSVLLPILIIKKKQAFLLLRFCKSRLSLGKHEGRRFNETELTLYSALRRENLRHRGSLNAHSWIAHQGRKS